MRNIAKILLTMLCALILSACAQTMQITKKEFVIKQINWDEKNNTCEYVLYNNKSKKVVLQEKPHKYQIGDTLILVKK